MVGRYDRAGNDGLNVPSLYTAGDDFTFLALVKKSTDDVGGHQTVLSSDRFRYQFRRTGAEGSGEGTLRLDVNGAGATGPNESGNGTFLADQWYFTALTYDAATGDIHAYLQDDSPVFARAAFTRNGNLDDMSAFRIGFDGLSGIGGSDAWGGYLDGARFYDQALTPTQLRDVFRTLTGHSPGPIGQVVRYEHEDPGNRLADSSGNGLDATSGGSVAFTAPVDPGPFDLGTTSGDYPRNGSGYLDLPEVHTPGDSFTFAAMVRKEGTGDGHQTILGTDRFRFQYRETADDTVGGRLRLDLNPTAGGGTTETPGDTFLSDQWHFVALAYDAATGQLQAWLQDGSPVFLGPEYSATTGNVPYFDDISRFRVGGDGLSGVPGAGFDSFGGQIDGIRYFDTLLSKRELRDVFRQYHPVPGGTVGLVAQYAHEGPDPLTDDTGHGVDAINRGEVAFVAPPPGGLFGPGLGSVVGEYPRSDNGSLDFPEFYTEGDDFTFTAFVRKDDDESGGHQTILGSNRFRFQYQDTGTTDDGAGQLRLDVNGAGASGGNTSGDGTFLTDQWYFVALRYNATTHELDAFLEDGSGGLGGPLISDIVNGDAGLDDMMQFRVGADGLSGMGLFDPFGGWIDSVRFYDRFLSDAELGDILVGSIPEPSSLALFLIGAFAAPWVWRWRRRKAAASR